MINRAQIHPAHCTCSRCLPRHPAEPRTPATLVGQLLRAARFVLPTTPERTTKADQASTESQTA